MNDFTNEEKARISELYGNDFKDIRPEDALLIGRWESFKAVTSEKVQTELKAIEEKAKLSMEQTKREHEIAVQTLEIERNAALARLERIENVK